MLEHLGLVVHPIPGHAERLGQEQLEQAVVAQHLERHTLARRREPDAAVGLVLDQTELLSFFAMLDAEPAVMPRRSARALVHTARRRCVPAA